MAEPEYQFFFLFRITQTDTRSCFCLTNVVTFSPLTPSERLNNNLLDSVCTVLVTQTSVTVGWLVEEEDQTLNTHVFRNKSSEAPVLALVAHLTIRPIVMPVQRGWRKFLNLSRNTGSDGSNVATAQNALNSVPLKQNENSLTGFINTP